MHWRYPAFGLIFLRILLCHVWSKLGYEWRLDCGYCAANREHSFDLARLAESGMVWRGHEEALGRGSSGDVD